MLYIVNKGFFQLFHFYFAHLSIFLLFCPYFRRRVNLSIWVGQGLGNDRIVLSQPIWLYGLNISGRLFWFFPILFELVDLCLFRLDVDLTSRLNRVIIGQNYQFVVLGFIEIRQGFKLYSLLTMFFAGIQVVWNRATRAQMSAKKRTMVLTLKHHIILFAFPIPRPKTFKVKFPRSTAVPGLNWWKLIAICRSSVVNELLQMDSVSLTESVLSHIYYRQFAKVGFRHLMLLETGL